MFGRESVVMTPAVSSIAAKALADAQAIVDAAMASGPVAPLVAQRTALQAQIDALAAQINPLVQQMAVLDAQIQDAVGPDARNAQDTIRAVQSVIRMS